MYWSVTVNISQHFNSKLVQNIAFILLVNCVLFAGEKEHLEKVEENYLMDCEMDAEEKKCSRDEKDNELCNPQLDQG